MNELKGYALSLLPIIGPIVTGIIVVFLRNMLLQLQARGAALEAKLRENHGAEPETAKALAVDKMSQEASLNPLLIATRKRRSELVERELPNADRRLQSMGISIPPPTAHSPAPAPREPTPGDTVHSIKNGSVDVVDLPSIANDPRDTLTRIRGK